MRDKALVSLLLLFGLRISEVLDLKFFQVFVVPLGKEAFSLHQQIAKCARSMASKLFSPRVYMCGGTLLLEEFLLSFGLNPSSNWTFSNNQRQMKPCMLQTCLTKNRRKRRSTMQNTPTLKKKPVGKNYADTKRKEETKT
jgi:hypothetical protein